MRESKTKVKLDTPEQRPATTREARENQLVSLAIDLAEKQLREGTASSQVITHYLKIGSTKEKQEKEKLEEEIKLLRAKTENLETMKNIESMYKEAIDSMREYGGSIHREDDVDDEDF